MVYSKLVLGNRQLLPSIILCLENIIHQPFVAACCRQHTAHQMIPAVRMGKAMQGIVCIHTKGLRGNKNGTGGAKGNVAGTVTHRSSSHCCCRIITGTCRNDNGFR